MQKNIMIISVLLLALLSCRQAPEKESTFESKPDYFMLHPEIEKKIGFTQAVRVGDIVKIMGVVSIDDKGTIVGKDNFAAQMEQCYSDIEKILTHYNCTFKDVYIENYFTTDMNKLHQNALLFRKKIYQSAYPSGTWLEVKALGSTDMMIEIEIEAKSPMKQNVD